MKVSLVCHFAGTFFTEKFRQNIREGYQFVVTLGLTRSLSTPGTKPFLDTAHLGLKSNDNFLLRKWSRTDHEDFWHRAKNQILYGDDRKVNRTLII